MVTSRSETNEGGSGREGGARADFIASLGKRVEGARNALEAMNDSPSATAPRDDLRRRLHALSTSARLLHLGAMAQALRDACAVLDRAAQTGQFKAEDASFIVQTLDDLPALAWGESPARPRMDSDPAKEMARDPEDSALAVSVLVVGPASIVTALINEELADVVRIFECEQTENTQVAIDLARHHAPDLVVLAASIQSGEELVASLVDDPLTEPVPIVVVGPFASAEVAARFTALGVARVVTDTSPRAIRATCDSVFDERDDHTARVTLGEPTLEQLGERLADEVRHALVESLDRPARALRVPLGEGTEVFGALWGAIARIQEVITEKTSGAIQYGGGGPEGAIALAPSLHRDMPGMDRATARRGGAAADVRLDGRRVIVADDDPGVTWFISDLLRTAGCTVFEALDGVSALNLAFEHSAELVVSDILMPGLDGFALCRALRRDVALRDTPVILLSWKEDLLQRVRELGASAAAYMRKESDSRAIVARVREVLRPRARLEARLRVDGEVRGRLDGVTVRTLLELMTTLRPNARVSVRDASFLYEIELRDGTPCKATRTSSDGSFKSGPRVLAAILGIGAGRFVVTSVTGPVKRELTGTLAEQVAEPIAQARGALAAATGAHTLAVDRVLIAPDDLPDYLHATPEPERGLVQRIAAGASPRKLLLEGLVAPSLMEDVLGDLAARGCIVGVRGSEGIDLLAPAVANARNVLLGRKKSESLSVPPPPARVETLLKPSVRPRPPVPVPVHDEPGPSLGDAILRELHAETPPPPTVSSAPQPPLATPRRDSTPPEEITEVETIAEAADEAEPLALSSKRVVAAPSSADGELLDILPQLGNATFVPKPEPSGLSLGGADEKTEATEQPPTVAETTEVDAPVGGLTDVPHPPGGAYENPFRSASVRPEALTAPAEPAEAEPPKALIEAAPFELTSRRSLPPADDSSRDIERQLQNGGGSKRWAIAFVVPLGLAFVAWYTYSTQYFMPAPLPHPTAQPGSAGPREADVRVDDLPTGTTVNDDQGLLRLTTVPGAVVRADDLRIGEGPAFTTALASGRHVIEVVTGTGVFTWTVDVTAGRRTTADLRPPP